MKELTALMQQFPAVALLGARQVGKTTLAKQVAAKLGRKSVYFDMEKNADRKKLHDIEAALSPLKDKCVIIDEAQAMPELFTALRPLIDDKRKAGRFLLLGSVAPYLIKGISESLAGRIAHLEVSPLNLMEAKSAKISQEKLWLRGGYPEALTLKRDSQWADWAENYFKNFVERDVNFLMGETLSPTTVRHMWTMLSGINGNILNHDSLSRSLGISRPTVLRYLAFMEGAYLIRRLQPWFINITKRIVKAPKLYFRDTGVLHHMNRIHDIDSLRSNIHAGASWESFAVEQISQLKSKWLSEYYYRTHHGAEADLVLVKGTRPVACIEIKLSNSPDVSKGLFEVKNDLKTKFNYIITPASDEYPVADDTIVCNLPVFISKHLPKIK